MDKFHRLVTTCLGIGYTPKGGGTLAAIACCLCWYFALESKSRNGYGPFLYGYGPAVATILILALGVWSANKMEAEWGEDSPKIVIDEVAGMCLTLLFVPVRWPYVIGGLILFRFFDIAKPLYIRKMESFPGGWGVMMDDVLAGIYSNIILQVIVVFMR
jgi:phosphatidylglycerophosphatase A